MSSKSLELAVEVWRLRILPFGRKFSARLLELHLVSRLLENDLYAAVFSSAVKKKWTTRGASLDPYYK